MALSIPQVCLTSGAHVGAGALSTLTGNAVTSKRPVPASSSAVDIAYDALSTITQLTALASPGWNVQHGLILSASAVAAAEDYFRSVLSRLVSVCDLSARRVRSMQTRMEFVFSGSITDAVLGVLDGESFSSSQTVYEWSGKISGVGLKKERSLEVLLAEYERVCHIRHAAVHAGGYLSIRNAEVLGVSPGSWISISSPSAVYDIIGIITATIRAFNQLLFEGILQQWLDRSVLKGVWAVDSLVFSNLFRLFHSKIDLGSQQKGMIPANPYLAYRPMSSDFLARSKSLT